MDDRADRTTRWGVTPPSEGWSETRSSVHRSGRHEAASLLAERHEGSETMLLRAGEAPSRSRHTASSEGEPNVRPEPYVGTEDEPRPGPELPAALRSFDGDPRVVAVLHEPPRPARVGRLTRPLPDRIASLSEEPWWTHQAEALDRIRRHEHTVVSTGTASGKSRVYQTAIAEAVTDPDGAATALCIYPTKALAQDQLRAFGELEIPEMLPATVDGDSGPEERTWARGHARVVLTNPEMLHHGMLAHHRRWSRLFRNLTHVVVDEVHQLRGMFGGHTANVLRRLRRVADLYGASPTFVFTSATIGRPDELAEALIGEPVSVVDEDGSPRGPRTIVVWNPFAVPPDQRPQSMTEATARVTAALVDSGHRTVAFTRSRAGVELTWNRLRSLVGNDRRDHVVPYRAGYLRHERREAEAALFSGDVDAVVATSALELGIDVGALDAVVCSGFPGTIASFHQQIGRAGRSGNASIAVLVCGEDQLDQWLARHPRDLLERVPEPAVVNEANPTVLHPHLLCAAHEYPLRPTDDRFWRGNLDEAVTRLHRTGALSVRRRRRADESEVVATWSGDRWPFSLIGLRSSDPHDVEIRCDGDLIGTTNASRAPEVLHEGAIYLHRGSAWRVTALDLDARRAEVERDDGDTYTTARSTLDVHIDEADAPARRLAGGSVTVRPVTVSTQVTGYQRRRVVDHELLETRQLELPPSELATRAMVLTWDDPTAGTSPTSLPGALHAAEHGAIGLLGLFAVCDRWDVGGLSTPRHRDTNAPTVLIHDGYPGGAGIAELVERIVDDLLPATRDLIASCRCDAGCPSCVQSPKCGNFNEPLDKPGAIAALDSLLGC